ncbi:MAG TPA: SHOCT domain-containing protein [Acidimicrobiales bacterium]|nr:SHOCT domain-containing protein [Acidimicrobiales bacterium]
MIAYTYPLLNIFWSLFIFFGFVLWIWVLVTIFVDIFRSRDIGGFAKAMWFLLVLIVPLIGALIYLVVRGRSMHERAVDEAEAQEASFRKYVQDVATSDNGTSTADELSKLAALAEQGTITPQEFAEQKAKLLGRQTTAA